MIDTTNIARFVSCSQAQYDSLYKKENNDNENLEDTNNINNIEKEIEDDNNSKSNSGEV